LISTGIAGILDGLRERRVKELQEESESRTQRLTEAQKLLTSAQRRLAHSERLAAIGRMAAGVSHEINNPLGAITGHIRLLAM
ncbi:MAG: histidine kinase dimerization/phospho-acceptor domain-containing protein, partial [Planctomycetota bacterium]|nr:histidine kinase dimerization/phospho-acceptor domain-containing protein [Planctomycetota bacterium]